MSPSAAEHCPAPRDHGDTQRRVCHERPAGETFYLCGREESGHANPVVRRFPPLQLYAILALLLAGRARAAERAPLDAWPNAPKIEISEPMQASLNAAIEALIEADPGLESQTVRVAVVDLPPGKAPLLAHWNGDSPVYPASVVKFVYLMAAFAWRDEGLLEIDPAFDRQLRAMAHSSSNRATQVVLARLTGTEPGPRLGPAAYAEFSERRHSVKRWLERLGITDLHTVHPTYDGEGDLHGRDVQFLQDRNIEGALPNQTGAFRNRQAMTANGTARLLALLATDRALAPETSAEVRERMRRDAGKQPYLAKRLAGGVGSRSDLEVFSKTGTWGPIFADAGIIRHASGHQMAVVVFVAGKPAYRGFFIAKIARHAIDALLPAAEAGGQR